MKNLVFCMLALALLAGCAPASVQEPEDGKLHIVATVFPAYDFARAAAGDLADVELLLPPGTESHSYEPTPADILKVQSCDLFLYLGGDSENRLAGADVGLLNLLYPDDPVQQGASGAAAVPVPGLYHHHRLSGVSRQKGRCPGEPCALV